MKYNGVVLFLGAGFSKSVGDVRTNLLNAILEHNKVHQDTKDEIKSLLPGSNETTTPQFELLLSIVQRLQNQHRAGRPKLLNVPDPDKLWRELVEAVAHVTYFEHEGRANWVERLRPLSEFLENDSVSVVSTNYDLIADKAVLAAADNGSPELKNLRRYQYGYPVRRLFRKRDDSDSHDREEPWSFDERAIQIYKLHGSTNWAYCDYCKELDLAAEEDDLWAMQNPTEREHCDVCGSFYEPILVPPVPNKGVMNNPVLAQVWQKAEKALETARLVIFVGYSLPAADPLVVEMLATARHRSAQANGKRWRFCVIDPCCCTHARYTSLFGSEGRHYITKFKFGLLWDCWKSGGVPFGHGG